MEGELDGGAVLPDHLAVRLDLDDVLRGECALVHRAWRDPDVPVLLEDGEVSTGRGGHAIGVDALHDLDDSMGGGQQLQIHSMDLRAPLESRSSASAQDLALVVSHHIEPTEADGDVLPLAVEVPD